MFYFFNIFYPNICSTYYGFCIIDVYGITQKMPCYLKTGFGLADYFSRISNGKSSVDVNVNLSACNGSVDELFALFDNVRRGAVTTSKMMLDFIGELAINIS